MLIHPKSLLQKIGFDAIRQASLSYTQTYPGREIISEIHPESDQEVIELALNKVGEMMTIIQLDDPVPLSELPDLHSIIQKSRIKNSTLQPDAILWIARLCSTSRLLHNYFRMRSEKYPFLNEIASNIVLLRDLEKAIEKALTDQGSIKDSASQNLGRIRRQLIQRRNEARSVLQRIMRQATKDNYVAEDSLTIRNGRMVIPIKTEHKRKLAGFVHDVSSTGQTVYLEPAEALNMNNDVKQLESEELREMERILQQLTALIGERVPQLIDNYALTGELDAIYAKAKLGIKFDASIPQISNSRQIRLMGALNPILLLKTFDNENIERKNIVPLNFELDPDEHCVIITGPNAGGKSVAMKTVGLCCLMMQSGYAIPANPDSQLPLFDGIFVDLGDDQSIENDLSTFSSHLAWIRETLHNLTDQSLVLIDEAGSGTDPEEGAALYQAFMELLIKKRALVVATTHHGSLKVFAHNMPGVINASMEFDQKTLSPTYRFKKGLPGSSYAFEIAARLGLDKHLLDQAKTHLGSSKNRMESLILDMEQKIQDAETMRKDAEILAREADSRRNEYEDKQRALTNQRDQMREKALKEARDVVLNANKLIEETVQKIKEDQAQKQTIKEARKGISKQRTSIEQQLNVIEEKRKYKDSGKPPAVGDTIRLADGKSTGELLEVKGNQALVLVNGMKLKTDYRNLVKVTTKGKKKKKEPKVRVITYDEETTIRPTSNRLDIRGFRGDAAINEVMQFIDRAVASGLNNLEIIHGKGYGILKQLVHDYLKSRPEVKSFKLAPWDQGGPGCTEVELK